MNTTWKEHPNSKIITPGAAILVAILALAPLGAIVWTAWKMIKKS